MAKYLDRVTLTSRDGEWVVLEKTPGGAYTLRRDGPDGREDYRCTGDEIDEVIGQVEPSASDAVAGGGATFSEAERGPHPDSGAARRARRGGG